MLNYDDGGMVNVGSSKEVSIGELAHIIAEIIGYKGEVWFDSSRPDGTPRKIMNNDKIFGMGWSAGTELSEGLSRMYNWWTENSKTNDLG
jgi:GDP-L-fucose synthase